MGSSEASEALIQVAEYLQAPVVSTPEGKGAISDRHYLSLGALRLRGDPIAQASAGHDVVLAVGTRLANPNLLDGQQVIQIDIDEDELGRNYGNTIGIQGDARRTLEELYAVLSAAGPARPSRRSELESMKADRSETAVRVRAPGLLAERHQRGYAR